MAALVVGIVAFFIGFIPVIGLMAGIAAVVLAIVALALKQLKGLAIPGLVLGAIACVASIMWTIGLFAIDLSASGPDSVVGVEQSTEPAPPTEDLADTVSDDFGSGVLIVGTDIAPGTYSTEVTSGWCSYKWRTTTGADARTIEHNIIREGAVTITLKEGEVFENSGCGTWALKP